MAEVGDPGGDEVVADDAELGGRVQHGDAQHEQQGVQVAELQGHEARVGVRRGGGGGGRRRRNLRRDEPVRVYECAHRPGYAVRNLRVRTGGAGLLGLGGAGLGWSGLVCLLLLTGRWALRW